MATALKLKLVKELKNRLLLKYTVFISINFEINEELSKITAIMKLVF